MSLIEKKNLNYLTTVEQFFLSLKGAGLSLSANDYHLIGEWEKRGVQLQLLCGAIERAHGRIVDQQESQKISLTRLQPFVEKEIDKASR